MFQRAVQLEEDAATLPWAAELASRGFWRSGPTMRAAAINLGTIHYNQRDFALAEELYRRATEADPERAGVLRPGQRAG